MNQPYTPDPSRDRTGHAGYPGHPSVSTSYQPTSYIPKDDRAWAVGAHLSTLAAMVLSVGWLSVLGPLAVWALHKDKSPFVRESAARAFNFNLVIWAMMIFGWICVFTLIGIPVAVVVWVVALVASVVNHLKAAKAASNGEMYSYPWSIKILS